MINKLATATASGITITLALFLVMTKLIAMQPAAYAEAADPIPLKIYRVRNETPVRPVEPDYRIPDPVDPPTIQPPVDRDDSGAVIEIPQPPEPTPPTGTVGPGIVMSDGPLVAIVRVAPEYPMRAITRNLEGYVIVEFDVLTNGSVANIRVVESSSPIFERAAVNAAKRFRYKARVVDGVAQVSRGIRSKISFRIDDKT